MSDRYAARLRQFSGGELSVDEQGRYVVNQTRGGGEPKGVAVATVLLMLTNILTVLGGLGLLSASAYAYIQFNTVFAGVLSQQGVVGGMIAGVLIALISCAGIFGASNHHFKALAVYGFLQFSLLVLILSVVGLFVTYINVVGEVLGTNPPLVYSDQQVAVSDYFLATYTKCCVQSTVNCPGELPIDPLYCPRVSFCTSSSNSTQGCYLGNYGATPTDPPVQVFAELCSALTSGGAVGPAQAGSPACGGGTGPVEYLHTVLAFVNKNVQWAYYAIGFLAGFIFIELVATIDLLRYIYLVENGLFEPSLGASSPAKSARGMSALPVATAVPEDDDVGGFDANGRFEFNQMDVEREASRRIQSSGRALSDATPIAPSPNVRASFNGSVGGGGSSSNVRASFNGGGGGGGGGGSNRASFNGGLGGGGSVPPSPRGAGVSTSSFNEQRLSINLDRPG